MIVQSRHPPRTSSPRHPHSSNHQPQGSSNKSISPISPTSAADVVAVTATTTNGHSSGGGDQFFDKLSCRLDGGGGGTGKNSPPFVMTTSSSSSTKSKVIGADGMESSTSKATGSSSSSSNNIENSSIRKISSASSFPGTTTPSPITTSHGTVLQGTNNLSLLSNQRAAASAHEGKKEEEEEPSPRRPLSAYNYFFKSERARLLGIDEDEDDTDDAATENGNETGDASSTGNAQNNNHSKGSNNSRRKHRKVHGKISFRDMANQVGSRWKTLSDEEKKPYVAKSEADRQRYREELAAWTERQKELKKKRRQEEVEMKKALKAQQKKEKQLLREQHLLFHKQQKERKQAATLAKAAKKRKQQEMMMLEQRSETGGDFQNGTVAMGSFNNNDHGLPQGKGNALSSFAAPESTADVFSRTINSGRRASGARGFSSRDLFAMSTGGSHYVIHTSSNGASSCAKTTRVRVGDAKAAAAPMFDAYRSLLLPEYHGNSINNPSPPSRSRSVAAVPSSGIHDASDSCSMLPHPSRGVLKKGRNNRMLRRANTIGVPSERSEKQKGGAVYDIFQDLSTAEEPEEDDAEEVDEAIDQALSILQKDEGNLPDDLMQERFRPVGVASGAVVARPPPSKASAYRNHPDHRSSGRDQRALRKEGIDQPLPSRPFNQEPSHHATPSTGSRYDERTMPFPHAHAPVAASYPEETQHRGLSVPRELAVANAPHAAFTTASVAQESKEPKKKKRRKTEPHKELADNKELDANLMDFWNSMAGGEDAVAAPASSSTPSGGEDKNLAEHNDELALPDGLGLDMEGLISDSDVLPMSVDLQGNSGSDKMNNLDTMMDLDLNLDLNLGDDTFTSAAKAADFSGDGGSDGTSRGPPVPMMEEGDFDKFLEEFDYSTDDEQIDSSITAQVQELQGCLDDPQTIASSEENQEQDAKQHTSSQTEEGKGKSASQAETEAHMAPESTKEHAKKDELSTKLEKDVLPQEKEQATRAPETEPKRTQVDGVANSAVVGALEPKKKTQAESMESKEQGSGADEATPRPPRQVSEEKLASPQPPQQANGTADEGVVFTPTSMRVAEAVGGMAQMPQFPRMNDLNEERRTTGDEEDDVLMMMNEEPSQEHENNDPYGFMLSSERRIRSMPSHRSMMMTSNANENNVEDNDDTLLMQVRDEFLLEEPEQQGQGGGLFDPLAMYGDNKKNKPDDTQNKKASASTAAMAEVQENPRPPRKKNESEDGLASSLFDPSAFLSSASSRPKSNRRASEEILSGESGATTLLPSPRTPSQRRPMMTAAGTPSKIGTSPAGRSVASGQSRRSHHSSSGGGAGHASSLSPHNAARSPSRTPQEAEEMMLREREQAMLRNMRRQQQQQFMVIQQQQQIMAQMRQMMVMNNIDPGPLPTDGAEDDDVEMEKSKNGTNKQQPLDSASIGSRTKKHGSDRANRSIPKKASSSSALGVDVDPAVAPAVAGSAMADASLELSQQIQESRQKMRMIQEQHAKLRAAILKGGGGGGGNSSSGGGAPQRMKSDPALHRMGGEDRPVSLQMQRRLQAQKLKERHVQLQQQMMQMQMMKHQQRELRKQQAAAAAAGHHPVDGSSSSMLNDLEATLQRLMPRSRRSSGSKTPRPTSTGKQQPKQAHVRHYGDQGDAIGMEMNAQRMDAHYMENPSTRNRSPKERSGVVSRHTSQKLNGTTTANQVQSSKEAWNAICSMDTSGSTTSGKGNKSKEVTSIKSKRTGTREEKDDEVIVMGQEGRPLSSKGQDGNHNVSRTNGQHGMGYPQAPDNVLSCGSTALKSSHGLATAGGTRTDGQSHPGDSTNEASDLSNVEKVFFA